VDADGSGAVDREEYLALHSHLYSAMNPSELLNLPPKKRKKLEARALRIAEREWQFDAQGLEEMDKDRFRLSFFQLTDAFIPQTDYGPPRVGLSTDEFLRFLRYVMHRLCVDDPAKGVCFRWDATLKPGEDWIASLPKIAFENDADAEAPLKRGAWFVDRLTPKPDAIVETKAEKALRARRKKAVAVEEDKGPSRVYVKSAARREVKAIANHAVDWGGGERASLYDSTGAGEPRPPRPKPPAPAPPRRTADVAADAGADAPRAVVVRVPKGAARPAKSFIARPADAVRVPRSPSADAADADADAPTAARDARRAPAVVAVVRRRPPPRAMSHPVAGAEERYTVAQTIVTHERQEFRQNRVLGDQVLRRGCERARPGTLRPLPHTTCDTTLPFGYGTHDPRKRDANADRVRAILEDARAVGARALAPLSKATAAAAADGAPAATAGDPASRSPPSPKKRITRRIPSVKSSEDLGVLLATSLDPFYEYDERDDPMVAAARRRARASF